MVSRLHADLKEMQQESARTAESMQAATHALADKAKHQLAQVSASLEDARHDSEQVRPPSQSCGKASQVQAHTSS